MKKIGILSDTHGYLDLSILAEFADRDEVWHAGDFGTPELAGQLSDWCRKEGKTFRGVYGNIDGQEIRSQFPEQILFPCEEVKVMMRHIGGSPPGYNPETRKQLQLHRPQLFVCGHSHILKVMYDDKINCLHINPGAAGRQGWHKTRTIIRLLIDGKDMRDCSVIELGPRYA